jgi:CDP-glucose 4,6-dehydratase
MTPHFWKGKKVFVTGHTGFKGSWISFWLQSLGARLTGYSLPAATTPSMFELAHVGQGMESIEGDIRDVENFRKAVQNAQPEILIHMAAQPLVKYGYAHPVETYATNVMGTVHALEAGRAVDSIQVIVVVTSDKCYENKESTRGYREEDTLGGHDPYSNSKGCAELVTSAYRQSYFYEANPRSVRVASARAGNVIGGGDWASDRLIPDAIRSISTQQPVLIRHPEAVRPWQHVCEPISGYLTLAEYLWGANGFSYAQAWNFGPLESDVRPVSWVVDRLVDLWGAGLQWKKDTAPTVAETRTLLLDCSKAKNKLGWQPQLTLDQALTWTMEWYCAHQKHQDLREITQAQISRYQALAVKTTAIAP